MNTALFKITHKGSFASRALGVDLVPLSWYRAQEMGGMMMAVCCVVLVMLLLWCVFFFSQLSFRENMLRDPIHVFAADLIIFHARRLPLQEPGRKIGTFSCSGGRIRSSV